MKDRQAAQAELNLKLIIIFMKLATDPLGQTPWARAINGRAADAKVLPRGLISSS